jgi:glycogen operon protein
LNEPDLRPDSHSLAVTVRGRGRPLMFHMMFNAYWQPLVFGLPPLEPGIHRPWRRWIDTYRDAPHDVYEWPGGPVVEGPSCAVEARSLVVLFAQREHATGQ